MTGALLLNLMMWVSVAIALAVTFSYIMGRAARESFPGGPKRYLAGLVVQAAAFMIPIPVVLLLMMGQSIAPGIDVVIAVVVAVAVLAALHYVPVTGPLLRDLRRSRLEAAMRREAERRK